MDELGIGSTVPVCLCSSAWTSLLVAAGHPDRVRGLVAVALWVPAIVEGWARMTHGYVRREWRDAAEFFFGEIVSEPHPTKVVEDCMESDDAPVGVEDRAGMLDVLARVRCPVLVVHGDEDSCQPAARADALAEPPAGSR